LHLPAQKLVLKLQGRQRSRALLIAKRAEIDPFKGETGLLHTDHPFFHPTLTGKPPH
jgi:hypothetical protein